MFPDLPFNWWSGSAVSLLSYFFLSFFFWQDALYTATLLVTWLLWIHNRLKSNHTVLHEVYRINCRCKPKRQLLELCSYISFSAASKLFFSHWSTPNWEQILGSLPIHRSAFRLNSLSFTAAAVLLTYFPENLFIFKYSWVEWLRVRRPHCQFIVSSYRGSTNVGFLGSCCMNLTQKEPT